MRYLVLEPTITLTQKNGAHAAQAEPVAAEEPLRVDQESAPPVLGIIRALCHALKSEGIRYCHWKSNNALDRSATGKNDLDLLVARADAPRFTQILLGLGFKQAFAAAADDMPSVLDYYGHDEASGRLVHVHAHYQLMMGQDMTKNYHVPLEVPYLASAIQGPLFKTPAPEFELIVLVLRLIVKHATWDTILMRLGALSASEQSELTDLQAQADPQRINDLLLEHAPYIGPALFADCLQSLTGRNSLWQRVRAARRLSTALSAQTRRSPTVDLGRKLWQRAWGIVQRHLLGHTQSSQRQLALGGTLIAVVGGDGAGKTSTIDHLHGWLAKELKVRKVHLGKPAWSITTRVVRALLKVARFLWREPYVEEAEVLYQPEANPSRLAVYSLALRAVCAARDRQRTYAQARRAANRGEVVICDRFPLPQIKMMEGAQVEQLARGEPMNWFMRTLQRLENHYLQRILPPDLLILLRLDPEIAVVRRSEEAAHPVRVRNREIWEASWIGSGAQVIDASQPQATVLAAARKIVWTDI